MWQILQVDSWVHGGTGQIMSKVILQCTCNLSKENYALRFVRNAIKMDVPKSETNAILL